MTDGKFLGDLMRSCLLPENVTTKGIKENTMARFATFMQNNPMMELSFIIQKKPVGTQQRLYSAYVVR